MKKILYFLLLSVLVSQAFALEPGNSVSRIITNGANGGVSYLTGSDGQALATISQGGAGTTVIGPDGIRTYTQRAAPVVEGNAVSLSRSIPLTVQGGTLKQPIQTSVLDKISIPKAELGAAAGRMLFGLGAAVAVGIVADMAVEAGHRWLADQRKWVHDEPYSICSITDKPVRAAAGGGIQSSIDAPAGTIFCNNQAFIDDWNSRHTGTCGVHYGDNAQWSNSVVINDSNAAVGATAVQMRSDCYLYYPDTPVATQTAQRYVPATTTHQVDSTAAQLGAAVENTNANISKLPDVPQYLADHDQSINLSATDAASYTPAQSTITNPTTVLDSTTTNNPDGTTTTTTHKETQTVSADTIGNNVTNNNVTYNVTTTTQTFVNNVLTNTTVTNPAPPPTPTPVKPTCGTSDTPACQQEQKPKPGTVTTPELDTAPEYLDTLNSFKSRVNASAIASSLTGLSAAIPSGGACPTATFNVFNHQFTVDAHCTIFDHFYSTIHAMFLMTFALSSLIIFFKA